MGVGGAVIWVSYIVRPARADELGRNPRGLLATEISLL